MFAHWRQKMLILASTMRYTCIYEHLGLQVEKLSQWFYPRPPLTREGREGEGREWVEKGRENVRREGREVCSPNFKTLPGLCLADSTRTINHLWHYYSYSSHDDMTLKQEQVIFNRTKGSKLTRLYNCSLRQSGTE